MGSQGVRPPQPSVVAQATSSAAAATLRRLELTVSRRLDGLLHGDHLGLTPGGGTEPAESREYRPGEDDVRRMDWAVTARTTVPHIRHDVADRELETWVLLDLTASMDFGTATSPAIAPAPSAPRSVSDAPATEKRDLAVAALAAVGLLTARGGNRVGAAIFTGDGLRHLPARSGRPALLALLQAAISTPRSTSATSGGLSFADALDSFTRGLARRGRRAGLIAVVSDFLDGMPADPRDYRSVPPAWEAPLRRLGARAATLAVEVLDPRELFLPDVGMLAVMDPETGARREVWTGSRRLRERYAAAAAAQRSACLQAIRRSGSSHLQLRTDSDWVRDIARHCLRARYAAGRSAGGHAGGRP